MESQSVQHTMSQIETIFKKATNFSSTSGFMDLETKLRLFWESQDFQKIYSETKSAFETMVKINDYAGILKVFNNKGLLSNSGVAMLNDLSPKNNAYLNFVLSLLKEKSDTSRKIREAIINKVRKAAS